MSKRAAGSVTPRKANCTFFLPSGHPIFPYLITFLASLKYCAAHWPSSSRSTTPRHLIAGQPARIPIDCHIVPVSAIDCAEWYRLQLQVVTWVVIPSSPRRDLVFSNSHYVEKNCQAGVWLHVLFSPHIILYYPPGMDSRAKLTGSPDISGVLGSYVRLTHTTDMEIWGSMSVTLLPLLGTAIQTPAFRAPIPHYSLARVSSVCTTSDMPRCLLDNHLTI